MSLSVMELQVRSYQQKITNAEAQTKKCERNYESLRAFKGIVERSQEDFNSVNSKKQSILAEVDAVKKNSLTAQRYSAGMSKVLNGIGSKIVAIAYAGFLYIIKNKLNSYVSAVSSYENQIAGYNKIITNLNKQIEAEKSEELAKAEGGQV